MKYNRFLKESLTKAPPSKSVDTAGDPPDDRNDRDDKPNLQLGNRKKIGLIDGEPKAIVNTPEGLTPHQQALREAVIKRFQYNRVNRYLTEQIKHINYKEQLADGIRFLFDEAGRPPANAPLEDFIAVREKIESDIRMLEALSFTMRKHLAEVKEAEEMAYELIGGQNKK
jgi:hypothetical protein